jgi:cytoskeletal protein CcmA (bactofilin family)
LIDVEGVMEVDGEIEVEGVMDVTGRIETDTTPPAT